MDSRKTLPGAMGPSQIHYVGPKRCSKCFTFEVQLAHEEQFHEKTKEELREWKHDFNKMTLMFFKNPLRMAWYFVQIRLSYKLPKEWGFKWRESLKRNSGMIKLFHSSVL